MEYFSTRYGLTGEGDPVSENGQLFLATFLLVCRSQLSRQIYLDAVATMVKQLEASKVKKGLYHRNPDLIDRRIMSHDNMSGIMAFLYQNKRIINDKTRKEIWWYLITHFGIYDNSQGKSKQLSRFLPFSPSNGFAWGLCAESRIAWMFYPFYWLNLIICCRKPANDTTGKILTYVELTQFRGHLLARYCWRYFYKKMEKQYGAEWVRALMKGYHGNHSPEFPIRKYLGI